MLHKLVPFFALVLDLLLLASALAADARSPRNRRFALVTFVLAVWNFGVLGLRWTDDPTSALAWERLVHVGVVAIPVAFYEYVWVLIGESRRRLSLTASYALGAGFMLVVPTAAFMTGVRMTVWGFAPVPGPLYGPFLVYFVAYTVLGLVALARCECVSTFRKNRIRLVMVGVLVTLLGGIVDFIRFTADMEWLYPPGVPASMVFALALGVAIVRYHLIDLTVMAKRALLYALAWVAMAPALVFAIDLLDDFAPSFETTSSGVKVHTIVVMLGVLLLALPVMRKLEHGLDRVMFRRQLAIRDALLALNKEISTILDVERLAATLTGRLASGIPTTHATLYLPAETGGAFAVASHCASGTGDAAPVAELDRDIPVWLRANRHTLVVDDIACQAATHAPALGMIAALERRRAALVLPVCQAHELTGILVVGDKLSGEVFDRAEIELLEILAGQTATALSNARLYNDLAVQMAELRTTRDLYGQAAEANRAKQQFLAMLAHELRNPLAPILNAAHALESTLGGTSEPSQRLIAIIRRQGHQLARLVDDLLDVSRIQLGKIRLNTQPLDLRDVVARSVDTLRASGKGHGRNIRVRLTEERVVVIGDRVRLEQVFWNLLDNAIKYSPPGTPVSVTVERDGDAAAVRILDWGVGIAPEMLPRIFDLFTQAQSSLDRSQGGLGLGLALVRSLVDQHRGAVEAHSDGLGHGSEFVVRLPLTQTADTTVDGTVVAGTVPCRRILVVEDMADTRDSLRALLQADGHRVECAEDGPSGVERALEWAPEVALIDIGLPGIDGYEVARRLRASWLGRSIYLVAVTGYGQPEDRRLAMDSGFDAHIIKPATEDDLRRVLSSAAQATVEGTPKQ